ncbi:hypothetical protein [Nonomuraea typhae]|uniref:hypothetical protein n=1 Tax=Nonomuraea typhae TaxID=2603600 RepID=UPI0012FAED98|nr:hypothetical protein [Nonomuraea typhae]
MTTTTTTAADLSGATSWATTSLGRQGVSAVNGLPGHRNDAERERLQRSATHLAAAARGLAQAQQGLATTRQHLLPLLQAGWERAGNSERVGELAVHDQEDLQHEMDGAARALRHIERICATLDREIVAARLLSDHPRHAGLPDADEAQANGGLAAAMHAAAVGGHQPPFRGLIEDVADLREAVVTAGLTLDDIAGLHQRTRRTRWERCPAHEYEADESLLHSCDACILQASAECAHCGPPWPCRTRALVDACPIAPTFATAPEVTP